MPDIEPTVRATRYEVSCLPEGNVNARHFTLRVEHRGDGRWCVTDGHNCLGADGTWGYEPLPSNRDDDWMKTHRFDLDTAIQLAKDFAPKLTINGLTAADVLARTREAAS
ncbi:MAG: hypothetical protein JWO67_1059 [Streptosporangiaceae bacterium]|nr:hypothetical protein [Streptosporangiaceae bacterium]